MALFALADPHLGYGVRKPMAIFGPQWADHDRRLEENWLAGVRMEDTVLIPGDISWAMNLDEALPDLRFLNQLPGRKILSRGNHDYWWSSLAKMEQYCRDNQLDSISFLRNNSVPVSDEWLVCGTRGWLLPGDADFHAADDKIYNREIGRLRLSLDAAARLRQPGQKLVVCLHYPPSTREFHPTPFTELMDTYTVDHCLYGHIHGLPPSYACFNPPGRIRYHLVSADYLGFKPLRL
ncbi:MAG: metallophosphoesterase [Clostridiaceae bacterium]|nr:metallophosphoesterase [Clostridiaceae bacterium]